MSFSEYSYIHMHFHKYVTKLPHMYNLDIEMRGHLVINLVVYHKVLHNISETNPYDKCSYTTRLCVVTLNHI